MPRLIFIKVIINSPFTEGYTDSQLLEEAGVYPVRKNGVEIEELGEPPIALHEIPAIGAAYSKKQIEEFLNIKL